jgi:hypothetical protein
VAHCAWSRSREILGEASRRFVVTAAGDDGFEVAHLATATANGKRLLVRRVTSHVRGDERDTPNQGDPSEQRLELGAHALALQLTVTGRWLWAAA